MNCWAIAGILLGAVALLTSLALLARAYLSHLVDRRIAAYQNELVARHCAEVENIYRQMRGWRHDYHNHIQTMLAHLALGQYDLIEGYLRGLNADLDTVDVILKTGNVMLDAILNSKLSLAKARRISVDATASVPGALRVSDVDLCVLLGNLLDNAVEACSAIPDESARFIRVYIGAQKEQLYICITNATRGAVRREGGHFPTTKGETHGFGLLRIDRIARKYEGFVNRQTEEGAFATEILLPL